MTGVTELARAVTVNDGHAPPAAVAVMVVGAAVLSALWAASCRAAARWLRTFLPARPDLRGARHGVHPA